MNNREKLANMSNKELSQLLGYYDGCNFCIHNKRKKVMGSEYFENGYFNECTADRKTSCVAGINEWLDSEVSEVE